jgi:hypothetical protein
MSDRLSNADTLIKRQRAVELGIRIARRRDIDNLARQRFGRLTVISLAPKENSGDFNTNWLCICDCGKTKIIRGIRLKTGETKSCGCLKSKNGRIQALHLHQLGYKGRKPRCA